ncbi:MAG: hypothetical protein M1838_003605 [Thelocarpon superellum]|nr:MAG: hypothetical protein M1838_003605 [Thelocarpon superellum]
MAHSSAAPLKSILKKALVKAPGPSPPTGPSKPERDQETALYHARLIQEQKDAEVEIFNAIERLIELPSSSQADPAHPSMADVALVLRDVSLFQPSDYDALIEERNINQSCGYLLCPRPRRMEDTPAKFRIVRGKARGEEFRVLRKAELERWCSRDCAMRALHLRTWKMGTVRLTKQLERWL